MNTQNRRILLVDDMPAIHDDFRKILMPVATERAELSAVEAALFGDVPKAVVAGFELDSAYQGREGLSKVQDALQAQLPYAMAFVDMRMPPGWDGVQTIEHLWRADPRLQVVICTAYADHAWNDVLERLDAQDRLLILKKPFDSIEVSQLATTLTAKWEATRQAAEQLTQLEVAVRERTAELTLSNSTLQAEIDERKLRQSQLVQSEKLASIGHLAAGVAHEINNPIGFVLSNFGTLGSYVDSLFQMLAAYEHAEQSAGFTESVVTLQRLRDQLDLEVLREDFPVLLRESMQGIERVRQIVQDLRDFSRVGAALEWECTNLNQCVDSTLNLLASQLKDHSDVVKEYGVLPDIECQVSQINQVVMNLLINAKQAFGAARGRITIRTGTEGEQVWLEVADNGVGIAPETLNRIFEPFYTTRLVGDGTGLGLSLSYGIVQQHHGNIAVTSTIGQGSTFRVSLPKHQPKLHGTDVRIQAVPSAAHHDT